METAAGRKKILLIYAPCGAGHKKAAEALFENFYKKGDNVVLLDILDTTTWWYRAIYRDGYYLLIQKFTTIWKFLYDFSENISSRTSLTRIWQYVESLLFKRFYTYLSNAAPDVIIATHFLPVSLLNHCQQKFYVATVITDYYPHGMWIGEKVGTYFVASTEVKETLIKKGVLPEKIQISGIPFRQQEQKRTKEEAQRFLGISSGKFTLLLLSGGAGVGNVDAIIQLLISFKDTIQILVNTGTNVSLHEKLERKYKSLFPGITFFGFTNDMPTYYTASDVVITKPGGLTVTECLASGLPLLMVHTIPGQEENNAQFVVANKAGFFLKTLPELPDVVKMLLEQPDTLAQMSKNAFNCIPHDTNEFIYTEIYRRIK